MGVGGNGQPVREFINKASSCALGWCSSSHEFIRYINCIDVKCAELKGKCNDICTVYY